MNVAKVSFLIRAPNTDIPCQIHCNVQSSNFIRSAATAAFFNLRLPGIMIGRHFHANMKVKNATCKDNSNSKSREVTSVKFEINIK